MKKSRRTVPMFVEILFKYLFSNSLRLVRDRGALPALVEQRGLQVPVMAGIDIDEIRAQVETKIFGDGELPAGAQYEANLLGTHFVVLLIFAFASLIAIR